MIGVFDSGSGGLTVVRAIRARLPSSDILYFGDIANVPYGSKTPEELSRLTVNSIQLLRKRGATSIVSACNSVSASLAVSLLDTLELPPQNLIEMVGPTVSYFRGSPARLLVLATPATAKSGIYQNVFRMIAKDIEVLAISDLAKAIEFGASEKEIEKIIQSAFSNTRFEDFDATVLACTHYPLVYETFRRVVPSRVAIIDPALAVAERVEKQFWPREAGDRRMRFLVSKDSAPFRALVSRFFPDNVDAIEVVQ